MKIAFRALVFVSVYVAQTTLAVVPPNLYTRLGDVGSGCGILGAMKLPEILPSGIDLRPENIRKCAEHPLRLVPSELKDEMESTAGIAKAGSSLTKRACEFASPYGCSKNGFCWKVCDAAGGWCWTAKNGGLGDWETCESFEDCNTGMACGIGNCKDCGCSC